MISRRTLDSEKNDIVDESGEHIFLKGDNISDVCEIEPDLIIVRQSFNIILLRDWVFAHKFNAFNYTHAYNFNFKILPGFSKKSLPIVLARSNREICLFNVKANTLEPLVIDTHLDHDYKNSFCIQ